MRDMTDALRLKDSLEDPNEVVLLRSTLCSRSLSSPPVRSSQPSVRAYSGTFPARTPTSSQMPLPSSSFSSVQRRPSKRQLKTSSFRHTRLLSVIYPLPSIIPPSRWRAPPPAMRAAPSRESPSPSPSALCHVSARASGKEATLARSSQLPSAHIFSDALHELAVCYSRLHVPSATSRHPRRRLSPFGLSRRPSVLVPVSPRAIYRRTAQRCSAASLVLLSSSGASRRPLSRPIGGRGRQVPHHRPSPCALRASVFDTPASPSISVRRGACRLPRPLPLSRPIRGWTGSSTRQRHPFRCPCSTVSIIPSGTSILSLAIAPHRRQAR